LPRAGIAIASHAVSGSFVPIYPICPKRISRLGFP
jgi:hypothetical protein